MSIGTDTRLTGGSEIKDDATACRAVAQGIAYTHGDRVYWHDGCGPDDLDIEAKAPGGSLRFRTPPGCTHLHAYGKAHHYLITLHDGTTQLSVYRLGEYRAVRRFGWPGAKNTEAMKRAEEWEAGRC